MKESHVPLLHTSLRNDSDASRPMLNSQDFFNGLACKFLVEAFISL